MAKKKKTVSKKTKTKKINLKELEGRYFTTQVCRLGFPHLLEPNEYKGKTTYNTLALYPKEADLKAMRKEILLTAAEAWGTDRKKWPKNLVLPWKDGDEREDYESFTNTWYVKAKTNADRKLKVFGPGKKVLTEDDTDEVYGGRYARLRVKAMVTTNEEDFFVSLFLQAVQVVTLTDEQAEALGWDKGGKGEQYGGTSVDDMFDDEFDNEEEDEEFEDEFSDEDSDDEELEEELDEDDDELE